MRVHVKVHAYLRQTIAAPKTLVGGESWDVAEGTTAAQIAEMLGVPGGFPVLITVNGASCHDPARTLLKQEDSLVLSPVIAGG
ncbi:MAG TPA: MoaD/ThiS family protein [Syntrophorhabdales bacterium]|nr:MoaD/ThiS family protein [Syntrophorhabdales bacterium]